MAIRSKKSSGNVFSDMGFAPAEAEHLRVRSLLMIELEQLIAKNGWTQAVAAKVFGVTQPRVSDLVRGKIDKFSVDMLIEMLGRAGVGVTLSLKRRRKAD
jgi:predicted XRE-type DNA-binding protein